jgi:hypothetical protein
MSARTAKRNDAYLWATLIDPARKAGDPDPERTARQQVAEQRRKEGAGRTWAPGDALPEPPPRRVFDLDGAVWERQKAGHGCYRMAAADRRKYASNSGDYEGVRLWPHLLDAEGPLTELPGRAAPQHPDPETEES